MGVTDQQGTLATGRAKVCWGWPVAITAGLISPEHRTLEHRVWHFLYSRRGTVHAEVPV